MSAKCCGRCTHFTLVGAPRAAEGEGRCTIYGDKNPGPLVRWDHPWTVLFWPVMDADARAKREQWIAIRKREEAADAAPASSAGPPLSDQRPAGTQALPIQN